MKLKMNGRIVKLTPLDESNDPRFDAFKDDMDVLPRFIYRWDCQPPAGGWPKTRPKTVTIDADALFLLPAGPGNAFFPAELRRQEAEREALRGALYCLGMQSAAELQAELNKLHPPMTVPVPYKTHVDPYKPDKSVFLTLTTYYMRWVAEYRARDLTVTGYIQFPIAYRFDSDVIHVCNKNKADSLFDGQTARGRVELSDWSKKMVNLHDKELKELREEVKKRRKREEEENDKMIKEFLRRMEERTKRLREGGRDVPRQPFGRGGW